MSTAPFPVTPELVAIARGYRNQRMIADDVMPRIPVGKKEFKYFAYDQADGFTVPDTFVGRRGKPSEVEFKATEVTSGCEDYGLDDPVPQDDIDQAPPNYNPVGKGVERLTDIIGLGREKRVADIVHAAATYPAGRKVTLSGTSQWSDFTNSTPIANIMTGLDACVMRPNIMVLGRAVFTKLATHPDIVKAVHGTSGDKGVAQRAAIASLFELEDVLVGEGWLNSAKKGQAASLVRVWGKHAALLFRDRNADSRGGITFGFTAEFGRRNAGALPDASISVRGGQRVRVWESVKELVVASDCGYFIENAVA